MKHSEADLRAYLEHGRPTPAEERVLRALLASGLDYAAAAETLGKRRQYIGDKVYRVARRSAAAGVSPSHDLQKPLAPGLVLKGTSTHYDAKGNILSQWVKTRPDQQEQWEIISEAITELCSRGEGMASPVPAPRYTEEDCLTVYKIGDPHFGMLSWAAETGNDFNLEICERVMHETTGRLVARAPATERALIVQSGDLLHTDRENNRTNQSGHALDVAAKLPKVYLSALDTLVKLVQLALQKHARVRVQMLRGNHDEMLSFAAGAHLSAWYRNDPRVEIEVSPSLYHYYEFGNVLLGSHHGHGIKLRHLGEWMASERPEAWGRCKFRHWIIGHVHHKSGDEFPGWSYETLRTTAPGDAWHVSNGYRSRRAMAADVWHKEHGVITEFTEYVR